MVWIDFWLNCVDEWASYDDFRKWPAALCDHGSPNHGTWAESIDLQAHDHLQWGHRHLYDDPAARLKRSRVHAHNNAMTIITRDRLQRSKDEEQRFTYGVHSKEHDKSESWFGVNDMVLVYSPDPCAGRRLWGGKPTRSAYAGAMNDDDDVRDTWYNTYHCVRLCRFYPNMTIRVRVHMLWGNMIYQ